MRRSILLLYILNLLSSTCFAVSDVSTVEVNRNHDLSDDAVIKLSGIEQDPTLSTVEVTRRLQTSGLFSRIQVHRTADAMTINVDEKTTWFILPYFSFDSSSKVVGVAAGKASIIGQNGNMAGRFQLGSGNHEASVLFRDEFFWNSLWIVGASADFENSLHHIYKDRVIVQNTSNKYHGTSLQLGYHLTPHVTIGLNNYIEAHRFELPEGTSEEGFQLSHRLLLDYGNFYVDEGLTSGNSVRGYMETTNLISAFHFQKLGVSGQLSAYRKNQFNWIVRPKIEGGSDLPYYQRFEIGGAKLRSFPSQIFRCSSYLLVQNDVLLFSIRVWKFKVRPLAYVDWAFIENSDRIGIGSGFQFYLNKVAVPAIQFFGGYGFNPNGYSLSVAIGPQI